MVRRQQGNEFITAVARGRVLFTNACFQPLRHLHQQQVAHLVAQRIIQRLEIIQVDKQYRAVGIVPARPGNFPIQPVQQQTPVGQIGKGVVKGQLLDT